MNLGTGNNREISGNLMDPRPSTPPCPSISFDILGPTNSGTRVHAIANSRRQTILYGMVPLHQLGHGVHASRSVQAVECERRISPELWVIYEPQQGIFQRWGRNTGQGSCGFKAFAPIGRLEAVKPRLKFARRDGVLFHPKVQLCMHNSHCAIFRAGVLRLHPVIARDIDFVIKVQQKSLYIYDSPGRNNLGCESGPS